MPTFRCPVSQELRERLCIINMNKTRYKKRTRALYSLNGPSRNVEDVFFIIIIPEPPLLVEKHRPRRRKQKALASSFSSSSSFNSSRTREEKKRIRRRVDEKKRRTTTTMTAQARVLVKRTKTNGVRAALLALTSPVAARITIWNDIHPTR